MLPSFPQAPGILQAAWDREHPLSCPSFLFGYGEILPKKFSPFTFSEARILVNLMASGCNPSQSPGSASGSQPLGHSRRCGAGLGSRPVLPVFKHLAQNAFFVHSSPKPRNLSDVMMETWWGGKWNGGGCHGPKGSEMQLRRWLKIAHGEQACA